MDNKMAAKLDFAALIFMAAIVQHSLEINGNLLQENNFKQRHRTIIDKGTPEIPKTAPELSTIVFSCSMQFTMRIAEKLAVFYLHANLSTNIVAQLTNGMIADLCGMNYYHGFRFISCVQLAMPHSPLFIDKLLMLAFNDSALPSILFGGCNMTKDLSRSMECIIQGLNRNLYALKCLTDVGTFFTDLNSSVTLDAALQELCRTWGTMITCISPYIAMCNQNLANLWMLYGSKILNPKCHDYAFVLKGSNGPKEGTKVEEAFRAVDLHNSPLAKCADKYNRNIKQFLPSSVIDQAGFSNPIVGEIDHICGNEIQEFLYCIDERRLNVSSSVDSFMFQVISTTGMRKAFTKMCSQKDILKANIHCFGNSAVEQETCMCYMTDFVQEVMHLTGGPGRFSHDKLMEPFCSFYVSFVECYVDLLGTCSRELGQLMQEVYLGSLTPSCLGAKMGSCIPNVLEAKDTLTSSFFFHCGTEVARFVSHETKTANFSTEISEMMTNMQELVADAYNYTCSVGEEILGCLGEEFMLSSNTFDRLLLQMFNVSKFSAILVDGCNQTLIVDIKERLQYILSMILSDPRSSECIEALNTFRDIPTEEFDTLLAETIDSYCRTWADFSECIEAKLACSDSHLAQQWRQFTIESLNRNCHLIAIHQQEISPLGSNCDVNGLADSALSLCGMSYMTTVMIHNKEVTERPLESVILDEINHFCRNDMDKAVIVIECLQSTIFSSAMKIDLVVGRIFNFSVASDIVSKACSSLRESENKMRCIVNSLETAGDNVTCLQHLTDGFDTKVFENKDIDKLTNMGCRGWKDFSNCVLPHINVCDIELSKVWSSLTYMVLTQTCQAYIAKTARLHAENSARGTVSSIVFILIVFSPITCCFV